MHELKTNLHQLKTRVEALAEALDLPKKRHEQEILRTKTTEADFWADEQAAKKVMQELSAIETQVLLIDELMAGIGEIDALIELVEAEPDQALAADLSVSLTNMAKKLEKAEIWLLLSGPYDHLPALVSVHSGQGGTEAQDWAEMLARMYRRFFERQEWKYQLLSESRGEEAGIKAVTYLVEGTHAYGLMKGEAGTHRLVRQSPFNADKLRQTSFALVEVLPQVEDSSEVEVREEDISWDFFRAGGHGGQNVNKVNTAVRLRHLPSGLVVESSGQRQQEQNRKVALSLLRAKLWQRQEEERQKEMAGLKGQTVAAWGTQIRNYVLHPYHLVKDVRTGVETTDTEAVLDGDLTAFIDAQIRWLKRES